MKKLSFVFLILSLLISCSTTTDNDATDQIKGEWIWVESSGGIAGTTETPESTQKEIVLKISDNFIKKYINGTLESDQAYIIQRRKSVIYGDAREMVVCDNGFRQIFSITGSQLILIDDCNDCFQSEYQRN